MVRWSCACFLGLAAVSAGFAQDPQRVASPDGQVEFRLFIGQPEPGALFRLAYRVDYQGKPLLDTSFLALRIHNQEPDLGDNVGLTGARTMASQQYNTLIAEYMQNGSLGRRINVEARVYNDGVAFRYVIPESTPLSPMLLDDESTEFAFAKNTEAFAKIRPGSIVALPFVAEQPGIGWVALDEVRRGSYPRMYVTRQDAAILISRLPLRPGESNLAWEGPTPMTCPWRVLAIGATRQQVSESKLVRGLNP
jgi:alpha-glucosidase